MSVDQDEGRCPGCGGAGAVGAPCPERACAVRGLHHVPSDFVNWSPERPPDALIGRRIEKYLPVRVLGAGGFGTVYLALQLPIRMQVALKLLHRNMDPAVLEQQIAKFEGEARALATLNHPNVVRLIDYGRDGETPFLVMEFVDGARTLRHAMAGPLGAGQPLSNDLARHVLRQACDGLEAAHARGLVHRDVKPDNVMLQDVAGNPNLVRILDFGLAKFVESGSSTSHAMGTPAYLAPEQMGKRHIGPWTDVYALGVIAFEMLVGRRPFPGETVQEMLGRKIDPTYDPVRALAVGRVGPALCAFLSDALARDPSDRLPTVAAFRERLEAVLAAPAASVESTRPLCDQPVTAVLEGAEESDATVPGVLGLPPTEPDVPPPPDLEAPAPRDASLPVPAPAPAPAEAAPAPAPAEAAPALAPAEAAPASAPEPLPAPRPVAPLPFPPRPPVEHTEAMPDVGPGTSPPLDTTGFWSRLGPGKSRQAAAEPSSRADRRRTVRVAAVVALVLGVAGVAAALWALAHVPGATEAGQAAVGKVAGLTGEAVQALKTAVIDEVAGVPEGWARVPAGQYPGDRAGDVLRLDASLFVAAREVTRAEWFAVFANAPSKHPACGDACPVDSVTWFEAAAYANALSAREARTPCYAVEGATGTPGADYRARRTEAVAGCTGYRLPTVAEWEASARAGTGGSAWVSLADSAWYRANSGGTPHPVATRGANAWGLFDMLGNVREWTADGDDRGRRLAAGGSFADAPSGVGVDERDRVPADTRSESIGFRLVRGL